MEDVSAEAQEAAAKSNLAEEPEGEFFAYDKKVNIDPAAFEKAYKDLVARIKSQGKKSLSSFLLIQNASLDHNRWIQIVPSSIGQYQLNQERWMVSEMREVLGVPNLVLEVEVRTTINPSDHVPYTNEDRLKSMEEANPKLKDFIKKFEAFINYK